MSDTPSRGDRRPSAVVALGGNALLRRGEPLEAAGQERAAHAAAGLLARVSGRHRLILTHGNGPQVGLLALMSAAYTATQPYPLDVLGSESEGQIGYVLELALDNAIDDQDTVSVLTRVVVDAADPAFVAPTKFIGRVYASEREARTVADPHGWTIARDGDGWRRVVPSPRPRRDRAAARHRATVRRRVPRGVHRRRRHPRRRGRRRPPARRRGGHRQGPRLGAARCRPRRRRAGARHRRRWRL